MTKDEFLDHYDNDNQRFRDALDQVIKTEAVKFAKYIKGLPMYVNYFPPNPTSMEDIYDEFNS